MSAVSLSNRLGVSFYEGNEMLNQHHETFAQYWAWSDDWVQHALQTGVMWTSMGWFCRTGITEFNERSLRNWPVQSAGADILRIACILAVRHGIKLLAPIHDAVLVEASVNRIEADVALMQELMRRASRIVLNKDPAGTFELRTDAKIIRYPDSYSDARGDKVWDDVMRLLTAGTQETRKKA
jgi:DNA polymerase I-like protein with 3'-5' exonuclease and polymerase domains